MRHVFCIVLLMMVAVAGYGQATLPADTNRARNALHYPESALAHWELRLGYLDSSTVTEQQIRDNIGVGMRIAGPHQYPVTITQFTINIVGIGRDYITLSVKGDRFSPDMLTVLHQLRKRDVLTIDGIKIKEGDQHRSANSLVYTVR